MNCAKKEIKQCRVWNDYESETQAHMLYCAHGGCYCDWMLLFPHFQMHKNVQLRMCLLQNVSSSMKGGDHFTAVNVQTFYTCHLCSFLVVFGLVRHSPSAAMHYLLMRLKLSHICSVYFSCFCFFFLLTDTNCYVRPTGWFFNWWSNVLAAEWNKSIFELGQLKKNKNKNILRKDDDNGIILFVLLHINIHLVGKAGAAITRTFQDVYHKSLKTLYTRGEASLQHPSLHVQLWRAQNK